MNGWRFVMRGLWHFRAVHTPLLACCALAATVLFGALIAGDSLRASLRNQAGARIGRAELALEGGGRMLRSALADDLAAAGVGAAPLMETRAEVAANGRVLGAVRVIGVDRRFFEMGPATEIPTAGAPAGPDFHINDVLARDLGLETGAELVLRLPKARALPADAPLAGAEGDAVVLRGRVAALRGPGGFGAFSLENSQTPQPPVMAPLERLQPALEQPGMANLLLLEPPDGMEETALRTVLRSHWKAADLGLSIEEIPAAGALELRPSRILFDPPLAAAVRRELPEVRPVITYLANSLAAGGKSTPYSMVTAVDPAAAPFLPPDLDGFAVNSWLAEDLGVAAGDSLTISYYAVDDGERLVEREASLPVRAVLPLQGLAADRRWTPEFPGVAEAESTSDWDAGVPIDLSRIRDKDEDYWRQHRGTPKAFLPLEAGRRLFGNRWGEFTALRVPMPPGGAAETAALLENRLDLEEAGWRLRPLRRQALAAAESPVDFSGLLLSMSAILIAAALALGAMAFRFHIEQRNRESGLLSALGVPPKRMLRWWLAEGVTLAAAGALLGLPLAWLYVKILLKALAPVWDGGAGSGLAPELNPPVLFPAWLGFVVLMAGAIRLALRRQLRMGAGFRLAAGDGETPAPGPPGRPTALAVVLAAALASLAAAPWLGLKTAFFLGGALWLVAGLLLFRRRLTASGSAAGGVGDLRSLAVLNAARRPARSMVAAGALAAGVFMVTSVDAFRKKSGPDHPGAGGFGLWVETTLAGARSMSQTAEGDPLDLGAARAGFGAIQVFRRGPGDDASCHNLNRVAMPRLLATDVRALAGRGSFPIKDVAPGLEKSWDALRGGETMRAFLDESTLLWALQRKLGERLSYQDARGRGFEVELAGTLGDSVLQGNLIVDMGRYLERFPDAAPPDLFLVENGPSGADAAERLRSLLGGRGARVESVPARLAALQAVEHVYINIFQALGGLGVMLGAAGLGILTARNLSERRDEFIVMRTLGLPEKALRRLVLAETLRLTRWGLGIGVGAALLAILPGLDAAGAPAALARLVALGAAVAACAWLGSWAACRRYLGSFPA